jgi:hypothetical protein
MKCFGFGHWNRVPVNNIFIEQISPKSKVGVFIPVYEPLTHNRLEASQKRKF